MLDKYCIGCHGAEKTDRPVFAIDAESGFRNFTPSYVALHPYVRRTGPESDYFLQKPLEFHAGTSELIQMLEKGHHNVKLDEEAWDRLVTWIDLNVPDHGTWSEHRQIAGDLAERRLEMRKLYANVSIEPEAIDQSASEPIEFIKPEEAPKREPVTFNLADWPFDAEQARQRQAAVGNPTELTIELAEGIDMALTLIPAGSFVMGNNAGEVDEYPPTVVEIERPFYMGTVEVTNAQYTLFDAEHDSAYISRTNKDQGNRGHAINRPNQPAARVTNRQAEDFCRWLSEKIGRKVSLPTEGQWEWACRAGSASPFFYGDSDTDFGKFANLADTALTNFAQRDSPKWHPRDKRFNDGAMVSIDVGRYEPNAWGLKDMHGNVAEWTRTAYRPYPYDPADGRNADATSGTKSVRGGSWYDRPKRARAGFRMHYEPWQYVYNVGFRVVVEAE